MKRSLLIVLLLGFALEGFAQDDNLYLSSQRQPVLVSVEGLYQTYTVNDSTLSEFSIPLSVTVPIGQRFGVSLRASQASVTGDRESISSVSDAQLGLSYYQSLGTSSLVVSLGMNLPSGKRELTQEEFETSIYLSQQFFNFRVPGFGQGFNLAPGFVWAFPAGEGVVLGLGGAYQYKGPYKPLESMQDDYDPGDEVLVTGGLDVRVNPATNVSADVTFAHYLSDSVGGEEVFSAGDKVTATGQLRTVLGRNDLRLVARYRSQAKSSLPAAAGQTSEDLRTLPAQGLFRAAYRQRLGEQLILGLLAQARVFGQTNRFDSKTLFDLGLAPEVAVSEQVSLRTRFVYTLGDFTGFEVGGGLALEL